MLQHRNEGARQDGLERRSGASPALIAPICRRIHRQESCKPSGDWRVVEPTVRIELTTTALQVRRTAVVLRWHIAPSRLKPLSIKSGKPLPGDWQTHCHECRFFLLETAGEVRPVPVESLVPRLADYASNCHDRSLLQRRSSCPRHKGLDSQASDLRCATHSANMRTGFSAPSVTVGASLSLCGFIQRSASRGSVWLVCPPQALFSA